MNVAIIVAGGVGNRMGQDIPKQFINICDKPVLVYTLEAFQRHNQVDAIELVCIDGWQEMVKSYANQFNIDKLRWIVNAGSTVQESIRNGIFNLENELDSNDIVLIHDGIRPVVNQEVISNVISVCEKKGNAVSSTLCNDQIFIVDKENSTAEYIMREKLRKITTPQAYRFELIDSAYHKAYEQEIGIYGSSYANTMMVELGERLYLAEGSEKNIKLTTKEDLDIFKALLNVEKVDWIK